MRYQRRSGRRRILAPDQALAGRYTPVKGPARSWRCPKLLDGGTYISVAEIAEAEGFSPRSPDIPASG